MTCDVKIVYSNGTIITKERDNWRAISAVGTPSYYYENVIGSIH